MISSFLWLCCGKNEKDSQHNHEVSMVTKDCLPLPFSNCDDQKKKRLIEAAAHFVPFAFKEVCLQPNTLLWTSTFLQPATLKYDHKKLEKISSAEVGQIVRRVKIDNSYKRSQLEERREEILGYLGRHKKEFEIAMIEYQRLIDNPLAPVVGNHLFETFNYTQIGSMADKQHFLWKTIKIAFSLQGISSILRQNRELAQDLSIIGLLEGIESVQQQLINLHRGSYRKYLRSLTVVELMAEGSKQALCHLTREEATEYGMKTLSPRQLYYLLEDLCKPYNLDYENVELEELKLAFMAS